MITKVFGTLSILVGIFLIFIFPTTEEFEIVPFTSTAIILGIILIIAGVYLLRI